MLFKKKEQRKENAETLKKPFRILVVEDDPDMSTILALFIKKYGYDLCGTAESGEDAIEAYQNNIAGFGFHRLFT